MTPTGKLHEQGFNYALAAALRKCNPAWRKNGAIDAERAGAPKRVDILIDTIEMPVIAIECAYDGDGGMDAAARLDDKNLHIETAISVSIPPEFQNLSETAAEKKLDDGALLGYAVLQKSGYRFPEQGYLTGTVRDLAAFIRVAAVSKDQVEDVADKVVELIRGAGGSLSSRLSKKYIKKIAGLMSQRTQLNNLHTTAVLWLDAMLVQNMICEVNDDINSLPSYRKPVLPLALVGEWEKILETNWQSIFEPAVDALEVAGRAYSSAVSTALANLLKAVEVLITARLGSQINVGAELFPKISEDRKQAAAFYTLPATAEFLTSMTIRADDSHNWDDPTLFQKIKVADFACGTGTLLRAAVHRIAQFYAADGGDDDGLDTLYRAAMEHGVVGVDVSPIAAHLAVSSLVLAGNGKPYGDANIGFINVGNPDNTGSLEFLVEMRQVNDLVSGGSEKAYSGKQTQTENTISAPDNSFDYVLMNPPYSRTRGGQSAFDIAGLSETERAACQKRWSELSKHQPANLKAGMAASFLCVARNKIKPGGRIGFVLPLTAAFAQSWGVTRAMLVTEFEDIIAVTSAQREQQSNVSADTGMGEMLLVATKRTSANGGKPSSVLCVMPNEMPRRNGVAGEYGRNIMHAIKTMRGDHCYITAGKTEIGRAIRFTPEQVGDAWSHLGAHNLELAASAHALTQGTLKNIAAQQCEKINCPMVEMQDLFDIGPTHDLIGHPRGGDERGALTFHPVTDKSDTVGRNRALWAAQATEQINLRVLPTHKGVVFNKEALDRLQTKRGTLHYSRGLRWTSQSLIAASTKYPVFGGSAWTTLLTDDENLNRAFALWANSTFGAIIYWTQGSRTHGGRARMQVTAIGTVPVPDLRKLSAAKLKTAAAFFDSIADKKLLPVCQLHADQTRHEIDRTVADMLGLPYSENAMHDLRRAWCEEPSVHGNNKVALALLEKS